MPRPKIDTQAVTERLLNDAELMLKKNSGKHLVLSEIAKQAGMSQSNIHRFFPTKSDLIRSLATRWFAEIESESERVAGLKLEASQRLEKWVLTILRIKRERYDADPTLFNAYLALSIDHMDIVERHTSRLHSDLKTIVSDMVCRELLESKITLVEDATLLFRTPQNIAAYRQSATDERARGIVQLLIKQLK